MKKVIILTSMLLFLTNSFSQTPVPAGNVSGTWTAENSPYLIYGDITVPPDSLLSIKPGVTIKFQGNYILDIKGCLLATGTKDSIIIFTINDTTGFSLEDTTAGGWNGIRFVNNYSQDTSAIKFCKLEFVKYLGPYNKGGALFVSNMPYFIMENNIIANNYSRGGIILFDSTEVSFTGNICYRNNNFCFSYYTAAIFIQNAFLGKCINNIFVNNKYAGFAFHEVKKVFVINNLICNNSYDGLRLSDWAYSPYDYIVANNTICNNYSKQVYMDELYVFVQFYNNIIRGNDNCNVGIADGGYSDFYYCNIQGGINTLWGNINNYENNIESDPEFVNPTEGVGWEYDALAADWSLKKTSPCINAGTPDTTGLNLNLPLSDLAGNDRINEDRVDMGAYEYPGYSAVDPQQEWLYFNIFPVPANNSVTVLYVSEKPETVEVVISDVTGKMFYDKKFEKTPGISEKIDISQFKAGTYIVKVISGKSLYERKFVVK